MQFYYKTRNEAVKVGVLTREGVFTVDSNAIG